MLIDVVLLPGSQIEYFGFGVGVVQFYLIIDLLNFLSSLLDRHFFLHLNDRNVRFRLSFDLFAQLSGFALFLFNFLLLLSYQKLSFFSLSLLVILCNVIRDFWFRDSDGDDFDSRSILVAALLECLLECLIEDVKLINKHILKCV